MMHYKRFSPSYSGSSPRSQQSGFTLIEVIIAISITALIGVGTTTLLRSIIGSEETISSKADTLANWQRASLFMYRDFSQITDRSVRDDFGDLPDQSNAVISDNDDNVLVHFTRNGWSLNSFSKTERSELQRVTYELRELDSDACESARLRLGPKEEYLGFCLLRLYWRVLDPVSDSEPVVQVLIDEVDEASIRFWGVETVVAANNQNNNNQNNNAQTPPPKGDWHDEWPPQGFSNDGQGGNTITSLRMVELTLLSPAFGEIRRVYQTAEVPL